MKDKFVTHFIQFHFAFSTKVRRKVFKNEEVKNRTAELIRQTCKKHGFQIRYLEIYPEHIRITVVVSPNQSPRFIMAKLKKETQILRKEFKQFANIRNFWTQAFLVSTKQSFPHKEAAEFISNLPKRFGNVVDKPETHLKEYVNEKVK
ncbi:IS200/IS605 family transposase [Enterococcus sp. ZJ1622]|uniref:IS200/IS605 family transposase n=1 Tax=Enterococcus sp. ZJ1622 TaxID=2709401 RepID=UPI0013EBD8A6|nr:IS200/IS605 family transposase [Enterococcus sp. ZJ1622]